MVGCAHAFVPRGAPACRRRRARSCLALAVVMEQTVVASLARTASMNPAAALRAGRLLLLFLPVPQAESTAASVTALTTTLTLLPIAEDDRWSRERGIT